MNNETVDSSLFQLAQIADFVGNSTSYTTNDNYDDSNLSNFKTSTSDVSLDSPDPDIPSCIITSYDDSVATFTPIPIKKKRVEATNSSIDNPQSSTLHKISAISSSDSADSGKNNTGFNIEDTSRKVSSLITRSYGKTKSSAINFDKDYTDSRANVTVTTSSRFGNTTPILFDKSISTSKSKEDSDMGDNTSRRTKSRIWTAVLDSKLRANVDKHGATNWASFDRANGLNSRTNGSWARWNYVLNVKTGPYTQQEDDLIKIHHASGA